MRVVLYLIIVGISLAMFFVRREKKVALLLFYAMCLSSVNTNDMFGSSVFHPAICFLLSEIKRFKLYFRQIKTTDLFYLLMMMTVATLLVYMTSKNLVGFKGFFSILKTDLLIKYFAVLYAFFSVRTLNELKVVIKIVFVSIIILTGFGALNLITHHAIFVDWALEGAKLNDITEAAGSKFEESERFRVQSMHWNPFNYGYICLSSMLLFSFARQKEIIGNLAFRIAMCCCFFGIITCGTRTVQLCVIIAGAIYYLLSRNKTKNLRVGFITTIVLYLAYLYIPVVNERLQFIGSVFETEQTSKVKGSSLEMREIQYATVLYYIQGYEWLGRGYNFFNIDLGYSEGKSGLKDKDLWGLEGIYLNLLLERGIIGLMVYVVFWGGILLFIYKKRMQDKKAYSLCFSVVTAYLLFSIMTGELSSLFITMLILGIGLRQMKNQLYSA